MVPVGKLVYQGDESNFSHSAGFLFCSHQTSIKGRECEVCLEAANPRKRYHVNRVQDPVEHMLQSQEVKQRSFFWLIESLLPPTD